MAYGGRELSPEEEAALHLPYEVNPPGIDQGRRASADDLDNIPEGLGGDRDENRNPPEDDLDDIDLDGGREKLDNDSPAVSSSGVSSDQSVTSSSSASVVDSAPDTPSTPSGPLSELDLTFPKPKSPRLSQSMGNFADAAAAAADVGEPPVRTRAQSQQYDRILLRNKAAKSTDNNSPDDGPGLPYEIMLEESTPDETPASSPDEESRPLVIADEIVENVIEVEAEESATSADDDEPHSPSKRTRLSEEEKKKKK